MDNTVPASRNKKQPGVPLGRKILYFLVLLFVIPGVFLLLFEGGLRLFGYGYPTDFFLTREINGQEYYVNNPDFSLRFFPPGLARPAQHMAIPVKKPANTFRIVVLGGSAAMGDPDFSYGLSRMLQTRLQPIYPNKDIEVINAAVTAINSNVVLPIAKDCVKLHPDLFIVYLGNNEVIGPYGPGTVFAPFSAKLGFIRASIFLKSTRIGQLFNNLRRDIESGGNRPQIWSGIDMFMEYRIRSTNPEMENTYNHFRENLEDIVQVGRDAGAQIILSTVTTNLKDCPPFADLHKENLDQTTLLGWKKIYQSGIEQEESGHWKAAIDAFKFANSIDDEFANTQYRLASSFLKINQTDSALLHYQKARDLDALRYRADTRINSTIRDVAREKKSSGVKLVDAQKAFLTEAKDNIPGNNVFYDHVHLNFDGNYILAQLTGNAVQKIIGIPEQQTSLTEEKAAEWLAFTPWDKYRIWQEIKNRMESPAFANRMNNDVLVHQWTAKTDSLKKTMTSEHLHDAVHRYQAAIEHDQDDWVLHNNYGLLLLEAAKNPAAAEEQFQYVLNLFPHDYLTLNNLGLAFVQQNRLDKAVTLYKRALQYKSAYNKTHFNLGEVYEKQGKFQDAIQQYQQAELQSETLARIHHRIAIKLANKGDTDGAVAQLQKALVLWPKFAKAHITLGQIYARSGNQNDAIRHYSDAIQIDPSQLQARLNLANLLFSQRKYEDALTQYNAVLAMKPDLPEVQNNTGLVLCSLGKFDQGIQHFKKALEINPKFSGARNNMAGALSQIGRHQEAIDQLQLSLKNNPNDPGLHNNIGAELLKNGNVKQAIEHFEKALKLNPDSQSAKRNLNYARSQLQTESKQNTYTN